MSEYNIAVDSGASVRLKTAGKYCDRDIVVTAGADTRIDALIDGTITEISSDSVTSIRESAFYGFMRLASVSFPNVTSVGKGAFQECSKLTSVSFAKATTLGTEAFRNCALLSNLSFPLLKTIGGYTFYNCKSLTTVDLSKVTSLGTYSFANCTNLTSATFAALTSIGSGSFNGCTNLSTLKIGNTSQVVTLSSTTAFTGTKITATSGFIYVPSALLASYRSASNWSTYAGRFRAL